MHMSDCRLQTVEMVLDNCSNRSKVGSQNATFNSQKKIECSELKTSSNLTSQLDTRGFPVQLGNNPKYDQQDFGSFSGCMKNLRINGEVSCCVLTKLFSRYGEYI